MTDDVKARLASEYGLNPHGAGGSICHGDIVIMDNYNDEELLALLDHITAATRAPLEARIAELEEEVRELRIAAGSRVLGPEDIASLEDVCSRAALQQKGQENA